MKRSQVDGSERSNEEKQAALHRHLSKLAFVPGPASPMVRRQLRSLPDPALKSTKKWVSIFDRLNFQLPRLKAKLIRPALIAGLIAAVAIIALNFRPSKSSQRPVAKSSQGQATASQPSFPVLIPGGRQEPPGGPVAYDAQRQVASFKDRIGDVEVTVSQQPLPETMKKNPDHEVEQLAKGFSASDVLSAGSDRAYIGTSAKGPQTLILHRQGLLIFITSASKIEKPKWAEYLAGLS